MFFVDSWVEVATCFLKLPLNGPHLKLFNFCIDVIALHANSKCKRMLSIFFFLIEPVTLKMLILKLKSGRITLGR